MRPQFQKRPPETPSLLIYDQPCTSRPNQIGQISAAVTAPNSIQNETFWYENQKTSSCHALSATTYAHKCGTVVPFWTNPVAPPYHRLAINDWLSRGP